MLTEPIDLAFLLEKNAGFIEDYKKNPLMSLITSQEMGDSSRRQVLLDCIQVFSNYFQKTIMLRSIFTENVSHLQVAQKHLAEEFGHDISLMNDRKNKPVKWDAILDACSCWFSWKMFTLDNPGKTFLVHCILEASAHLFFKEAHKVMQRYEETNYFKIHADLDEEHEEMGIVLLEGLREIEYKHLLVLQQQGWDVLNTVSQRIAELTLQNKSKVCNGSLKAVI